MHIYVLFILFFSWCKTAEQPQQTDSTHFYKTFMYGSEGKEALKLKIFTEKLSSEEKEEFLNKIKEIRLELLRESVELQRNKNDLEKLSDNRERIFRGIKWASIVNLFLYSPYIVECIEQQNLDALNEAVKENRIGTLLCIVLYGLAGYCIKSCLDEKKDAEFDKINQNLRSDFAAFLAQRKLEDKSTHIAISDKYLDIYDAIMAPDAFGFKSVMESPDTFNHSIQSTGYRPFNPNDPSTKY